MSSAIDMDLVTGGDGVSEPLLCKLRVHDSDLVGQDAVFSLVAEVEVRRRGGIDVKHTLHQEAFKVRSGETELRVPRDALRHYSYDGKHITMRLHTNVKIDDSILFDTKVSEEQLVRIGAKPLLNTDAGEIIEPGDTFNFFANLKAIPAGNQIVTLALAVIGGIVMLVNVLIGAHDQFSAASATWVYPQYDSDGETTNPLLLALMGSGALGAGVWFLLRKQLRKYMQFRLAKVPARIRRGTNYAVSELFAGRARVALQDLTLRIVACNMECGQFLQRRGSETVTVSFQEPVRGVVLYEKHVSRIPAHAAIAGYFDDRVSFDPMFAALYPPAMLAGSHGIDLRWEIQLLHPEFVDQELVGPTGAMAYEDFLPA